MTDATNKTLSFETNPLPSERVERALRWLVVYSVAMYLLEEVVAGTEHSKQGWLGFLWSERIVALVFTAEYFLRWRYSDNPRRYPFSPMAVIDLIAIIPFYAGFFVTEESLHLIRTLRILRLLKFYRYSRGLQLLSLGFYRAREQLKAIGFATLVLMLASQAAIYEAEREAQPEQFASVGDAIWFTAVTVTTVGYGDLYPVTTAGRLISMLTFVIGVTLFGTFAAVMGSAFTSTLEEQFANPDRARDESQS